MAGKLTDDGTMDTVIRCDECGDEARYNFQAHVEGEDGTSYDDFVRDCIADFDETHECEEEEMDEDDDDMEDEEEDDDGEG